MLLDLARPGPLELPDDATLVVGSGAAGLALAGSLHAAGERVVLLESGPDYLEAAVSERDERNEGDVGGLPFQLGTGRARVLGGTTTLWHGQCMRLQPLDLQQRPWVPHSGWPFSVEELAPWYALAEAWFDVAPPPDLDAQWAQHRRFAPLAWDERRLLHDYTTYTPVDDVGRKHGAALRASPTARVVVNATVARVLVEAGRAVGVELARPDGSRRTLRAHRVVLAAGAIENARILQLSDPKGEGLGDGRASTGRFLQSHPVVITAALTPTDQRALADRYVSVRLAGRRLFPKVRLSPQVQQDDELLNANAVLLHRFAAPGFLATRRLARAVLGRDRAAVSGGDVRLALRNGGPLLRDVYRRAVHGLPTAERPTSVQLEVWLEQQPDPASRLALSERTDALGLRRAVADWRISDAELRTSRAITRWVANDLERLGAAQVRMLESMHDDGAWHAAVRDAAHPSGTTRMSLAPRDGVVDPDLAVHGVRDLWVVGSSVFPVAGYANPTLTIVALALRLADHLARGR